MRIGFLKSNPLKSLLFLVAVGIVVSCASTPTSNLRAVDKTMTVTAYCSCKKCTGWERTWYGKPVYAHGPNAGERKKLGITASGEKARPGTIAADKRFAFGTLMYVPGYGKGVVQDRGSAIQGDHIDVYFKKHADAIKWGRKTLTVRIWLPPDHPMWARKT